MKTKISNFLQSDVFILSLALLMGFLCHFFVTSEILASDKKEKNTKLLYASVFNFEPFLGRKLQSLEHKNEKDFGLSSLLENNFNISMREDNDYKYVDIETSDKDNKSLKIDIDENFINIKKEFTNSKTIEKENEKIYSSYASSFSRSLSVPDGVDQKKAEIIQPDNSKANKITIKFPKLKLSNS